MKLAFALMAAINGSTAGVYAVIVSGTQSLPEHPRAIVVVLRAGTSGRERRRRVHRWRDRRASSPARPGARPAGHRRNGGLRRGALLPCPPVTPAGERRTLIG